MERERGRDEAWQCATCIHVSVNFSTVAANDQRQLPLERAKMYDSIDINCGMACQMSDDVNSCSLFYGRTFAVQAGSSGNLRLRARG